MPPFALIFVLLLAVPLLELYLLIVVGQHIGVLPTVLLVILTAIIGTALLRWQGLATLNRAQASLRRSELPATELIEGLMLLVGGVLLLTPGFITDALGFLCLVPVVRRRGAAIILRRAVRPRGDGVSRVRILDGEFHVEDERPSPRRKPGA